MPYEIRKESGDADGEFCVYEKEGGKVKCHPTQEAADAHMAAMYANVEDASGDGKSVDLLVTFNGEIKALGGGKYGGYLIRFTPQGDYDLTRDRFAPDTDYGIAKGEHVKAHLFFNHAQPLSTKSGKKLHIDQEIGTAQIWLDDEGVAIIAEAYKEYQAMLDQSVKSLGWSSGAPSHLVKRTKEDKGYKINRWFVGDDASLTPTPAEYRNQVIALKSVVIDALPGEAEDAASVATQTQSAHSTTNEIQVTGGNAMNEQELKALTDRTEAQTKAIDEQGKQIKTLTDKLDTVVDALKKEKPKADVVVTRAEEDTSYKMLYPRAPFGKFLDDVRINAMNGTLTPQLKAILGSNESVPSEGGFLVQTEQATTVEKKMFDSGILAARCSSRTIGAGANSVDLYGRDEDTRANGSRYGGVTAYRVAEAATITASGALKFYRYTLKPKEYAAIYYATNDVLQDTNLLEQEVMDAVPAELAFMLDDDIFEGLGAAGCLGFTNHAALVSVTRTTASHIKYDDVVNMWARLFALSRANAVWLINQDVEPDLYKMSLAVGTGGVPVYLPAGGASTTPYATLFGRPVIPIEFASTLGTKGDVVLADLTQYQLATKGGLQGAQSIHVAFLTNQNCYRFIMRYDGQPKWKTALTPFKGTGNTQSPFVAVAT